MKMWLSNGALETQGTRGSGEPFQLAFGVQALPATKSGGLLKNGGGQATRL
jgi:hypothetical protein